MVALCHVDPMNILLVFPHMQPSSAVHVQYGVCVLAPSPPPPEKRKKRKKHPDTFICEKKREKPIRLLFR